MNKYQQTRYLIQQLFHGVILPQQVVDLILAVNRWLALTGAAEILGHLTRIVLIFLKVPPLRQLHGKMRNMRHIQTQGLYFIKQSDRSLSKQVCFIILLTVQAFPSLPRRCIPSI